MNARYKNRGKIFIKIHNCSFEIRFRWQNNTYICFSFPLYSVRQIQHLRDPIHRSTKIKITIFTHRNPSLQVFRSEILTLFIKTARRISRTPSYTSLDASMNSFSSTSFGGLEDNASTATCTRCAKFGITEI